jgi:hypothetical protein
MRRTGHLRYVSRSLYFQRTCPQNRIDSKVDFNDKFAKTFNRKLQKVFISITEWMCQRRRYCLAIIQKLIAKHLNAFQSK